MTVIEKVNDTILQPLVYLLMAVAVAYFIFGVMMFVRDQGSDEAQTAGKKHMFWGVLGLAIMVSVWGILNFLNSLAIGLTS